MSCDVMNLPRICDLHFNTVESTLGQASSAQGSCDRERTVMGCAGTRIFVRKLGEAIQSGPSCPFIRD